MPKNTLKLRVCSWNVGNVQPPADLRKWLGIDNEDEYDIIVVGAQEANYEKPEKTQSPTSILNTDTSSQNPVPEPAPLARQSSISLPSIQRRGKRFTKLAKAIKVAKTTIRDGSSKKTRLKAHSADSEDSYWGKYVCPEDSTEEARAKGIPVSSSSMPMRTNAELQQRFSEDIPSLTFSQFVKAKDFDDLDESLVRRSRKSSRLSEVNIYREPSFDSSSSEETASQDSLPFENESFVDEEIEIETMDFGDLVCTQENFARPKKLRSQMTSLLRIEDESTGEKKFSHVVEKNMPDQYKLVAKSHLLEIKLLIFLHKRHEDKALKTKRLRDGTGFGNMWGNKGAIAFRINLNDTTFWFVSSHLAAHEGAKFLGERHADVRDIMKKIEKSSGYNVPLIHQVDHVFWLGDLNYRLDLPHLLPVASTWSREKKLAYVLNKISEKQYSDLSSFDELRREMEDNKVFGGFKEGKLQFAPTFKVVRGQQSTMYQPNRVPSYCDRILWHSLPMHRHHVRLRAYDSVTEYDTSDHKPVFACFDVVTAPTTQFLPFPLRIGELAVRCTIDFLRIQVDGLYEKRMEAEDDIQYEVLEDGALAVSDSPTRSTATKSNGAHTRQVVMLCFHGNGLFIKRKPYRVEVPLRQGRREAIYSDLPTIPLRPVKSLAEFMYKYITIVFTKAHQPRRRGISCVIPLAKMLQAPGRHRADLELDLLKYCVPVAKVRVLVELVPSATDWVDVENRPTMFKMKNQTVRRDAPANGADGGGAVPCKTSKPK
ncbi:Inositol polyphosphate-related phosphatase [Gracilaria domingensis]|nr:Inositol polyphosphate-related phosphatase [Gracilaria domingensis]